MQADQIFDFGAGDGLQDLVTVEHAGDVGHVDEPLGVNIFGAGRGHVVGVDVVDLAVSAESQAGGHRDDPGTPQRLEEIQVDAGEIPDKPERAGHLVVNHRLGEEGAGVGSAQPDRRLAGRGDGACQALVQQAAENHHGDVASLTVRDAQAVDELALHAHAFQSRRKNLAATMNDQQFMALVGQLCDLPRKRLDHTRVVEQRPCDFDDHSHCSPIASSKPSIPFMFCTA